MYHEYTFIRSEESLMHLNKSVHLDLKFVIKLVSSVMWLVVVVVVNAMPRCVTFSHYTNLNGVINVPGILWMCCFFFTNLKVEALHLGHGLEDFWGDGGGKHVNILSLCWIWVSLLPIKQHPPTQQCSQLIPSEDFPTNSLNIQHLQL